MSKAVFKRFGAKVINVEDLDDELRQALVDLLAFCEELAVRVNTGIYDINVVNRMYGSMLLTIHKQCTPFMDDVRRQRGIESIYSEFDRLNNDIHSLRKGKHYDDRGSIQRL